jgi:predicted aldo/keto reductase-like oxidoreductase
MMERSHLFPIALRTEMQTTRDPRDHAWPEGPHGARLLAENRFLAAPAEAFEKPVCRLGLASHGQTSITPDDVLYALGRGVNFLNWPGEADSPGGADAFSAAIASLGPRRDDAVVCVQFGARTASDAANELPQILTTLRTDYVDVLTFYYVETPGEWQELAGPGGALDYCRAAKRDAVVRRLGLTSHQRPLAAEIARSGLMDLLMIRYNAAHRGAEREVFPVTDPLGMPVIAYTALRWGALLQPTPDDPPRFHVPPAPAWYHFVLHSRSVAVTLAAPHTRAELEQDLEVLTVTGPLDAPEYTRLAEHGNRVRRSAGHFR